MNGTSDSKSLANVYPYTCDRKYSKSGIEELGRDVACEVESDWMVPLLFEDERDRLIGWQLGVSL